MTEHQDSESFPHIFTEWRERWPIPESMSHEIAEPENIDHAREKKASTEHKSVSKCP
jgi:hypothetical protein